MKYCNSGGIQKGFFISFKIETITEVSLVMIN